MSMAQMGRREDQARGTGDKLESPVLGSYGRAAATAAGDGWHGRCEVDPDLERIWLSDGV